MNKLLNRAREAFDDLSSREQRLVIVLGAIFGMLCAFVPVFLMWSANAELEDSNASLRALIARIQDERITLQQTAQAHASAMARYDDPAPPLGSYMESLAKAQNLTIREVTEEPSKVVGNYERRHAKVTLDDVGLFEVMHLLDALARSAHPVAVEQLSFDHNKPGDVYDVKIGVIAFDRKRLGGKGKAGAGEEG